MTRPEPTETQPEKHAFALILQKGSFFCAALRQALQTLSHRALRITELRGILPAGQPPAGPRILLAAAAAPFNDSDSIHPDNL